MAKPRPFNGRVIFDHLPKTGGEAIRSWLTSTLGTGTVSPHLDGDHQALIRRYGGIYSVITAHVAFQGDGLDPRYQYFTCFREPIDRALSWLFFAVGSFDESRLGPVWHEARRFVESEGEEIGPRFVGNVQNLYVEHFCSVLGGKYQSDSEKVDAALSVVDQYDLWGLFENFTGFLEDVASLIGIPAMRHITRVNVTRAKPKLDTISPRLRRRLEDLNGLDIALYGQLRERWASRRLLKAIRVSNEDAPWSCFNVRGRAHSVREFQLVRAKLEGKTAVSRGEPLLFDVQFSVTAQISELQIGINIYDEDHRLAFGTNTKLLKQPLTGTKPGTHRFQYCLMADLPEGKYEVGFTFSERCGNEERSLAWFEKVAAFSVSVPRPQDSVGYASLPVVASYRQISEQVAGPITDASGTLHLCAAVDRVGVGEEFFLPVRVENTSKQAWISTQANSLNLSYHWLDHQGNPVIYEGERTPFPVSALAPSEAFSAQVRLVAPDAPGAYRLVLTALQEGWCWLDQRGFTPFVLDAVPVNDVAVPEPVLGL